jgi:hypothetical protein
LRREDEGLDPGPARDRDWQILIRLDWTTYQRLSMLGELRGVAPTTMARTLLRGALHRAWREQVKPIEDGH